MFGEILTATMAISLWSAKPLLLSLLPALATASTVTVAMIKMMFSTSLSLALVPSPVPVALSGTPRTILTSRTASVPWVTALLPVSVIAPVVVVAALAEAAAAAAAAVALLARGKDTALVLPAAVMMTALMI